jgi:mannose-1-phosphate guanylyltransferase
LCKRIEYDDTRMAEGLVSEPLDVGGTLVLCAGYGTRLRPLTDELPKALLPVGDRPVLAMICDALRRQAVPRVVINAHHLSDEFKKKINELDSISHVSYEVDILGTAGGVANARRFFGQGPVIVWNGDILCDPPTGTLASAVDTASNAGVGGCLLYAERPAGEGNMGVLRGQSGQGERLVRLREERFGEENVGGDYVGICVLSPPLLAQLPDSGCLVGDALLPWLRAGGRVGVRKLDAPWAETGSVASYANANASWLQDRGKAEWCGPGATVADGVRLRASIVGAGAEVVGTGTLDECVVWPGARAVAPLSRAIVTPRRVVPVGP